MRKIQTGFAVACLLASAAGHAQCAYWQADCDDEDYSQFSPAPSYSPSPPSAPPVVVQPVVITAPNPPPPPVLSPAPYSPPPPPAAAGGSGSLAMAESIVDYAPRSRTYCRSRSESCAAWALRVTARPANNYSAGICYQISNITTPMYASCSAVMNSIYNGTDYRWVCAAAACAQ
jgi:hypothetical protein